MESKILQLAKKAKDASYKLALVSTKAKNDALNKMARALTHEASYLIRENGKDLKRAKQDGLSAALIDRLTLNDKRINEMARCLLDTSALVDPVGEIIAQYKRPNGLKIDKVRTPIGVVGIIYESRPNVTSDCIGLCLKSGNAVILKGGKEAACSNKAIFNVLKKALAATSVPADSIQMVDSTDRESVKILLKLDKYIDVIVPRGGEGLIKFVAENSTVAVIKHYKGVCHTYVSDKANLKMAEEICFNAKVQRPGVCNAMEKMLVHEKIAKKFLPAMITRFKDAGVEIRACNKTMAIVKDGIKKAVAADWDEEYLDLVLTVKVVKNVDEAINHINAHGSHHSDAIVTQDEKEAGRFLSSIDSTCLYVNASTRFTDGYQFGFGAEIGISTDKLHARGPMALPELTTYKYLVYGKGQIRV